MENLKRALAILDIPADDIIIKKFGGYMEQILSWNEKVNLTTITDTSEFVLKHFIDSVITAGFDEYKKASNVIDVGTGAGFPGVPLAIISPAKKFVLMDSLQKRLNIIDEICKKMEINNISTVHARAEELARDSSHREQYDLCVSRAVANLATLSEYCLPFIRRGGYLLAYKGPEAEQEIKDANKAIKILGGRINEIRGSGLEKFDIHHNIVIIEKVSETPGKYPRKAGTPSKQPIR